MNYKSRLKKNDQVEVISGKDKGRVGKILKLDLSSKKAIVEKVNIVHRHTKSTQANQQGGIVSKEAMINITNLNLICPKCSKTVRFGYKQLDDGSKIRICKKCNDAFDVK